MRKERLERLDRVFSRKVLGSVFLGGTAGKILERIIDILAPTLYGQLIAWSIAFVLALLLFLYWEAIESTVEDPLD